MNRRGVLLSLLLSASALIIVFSIPSESIAQRHPIELIHTGTDPIGSRIAYQVREILQTSATLSPFSGSENVWFRIRLMTMSINSIQQNDSSCFSAVLVMCEKDAKTKTVHETYFNNILGASGGIKVREMAEGIIAGVSKDLDGLRAPSK